MAKANKRILSFFFLHAQYGEYLISIPKAYITKIVVVTTTIKSVILSVDGMRFYPFPVIILLFKTSNTIDRGILQLSFVSSKLKQTPLTNEH